MAENKRACVVGGSGNLASLIIKLLLEKGYSVNTTVRDPGNPRKTDHFAPLRELGDLKVFTADLTDEESFHAPVSGCNLVFHIATPVHFDSHDPENDMIKPAIQGVHNVMRACVKAKTVKRVILTSSAAAVTVNNLSGTGFIMDEKNWTDVDFLAAEKPPTWGYPVSKTLAEKAAWKFAEEHKIELITVLPALISGAFLTSEIPASVHISMALITGNEFLINALKGMQTLSGSISMAHVEDVSRAHIFLAEKESASGRYVCCGHSTSVPELAKFLKNRYPQYSIPTEFGDFPSKNKLIISSEKLINEGFSFKYTMEDIYDEAVTSFRTRGLIN